MSKTGRFFLYILLAIMLPLLAVCWIAGFLLYPCVKAFREGWNYELPD